MESNESVYLSVTFEDRIDQKYFLDSNKFLKIVNLNSDKPLIQLDRHVFVGTYHDVMGTNVYFEEVPKPREADNVFTKSVPIHLEYLQKANKSLHLRYMKVPENVQNLSDDDLVDAHFLEDYKAILAKIEAGSLDIQAAVEGSRSFQRSKASTSNSADKVLPARDPSEIKPDTADCDDGVDKKSTSFPRKTKRTKTKYELLKSLACDTDSNAEDLTSLEDDNLFSIETGDYVVLKQLYLNNYIVTPSKVLKQANEDCIAHLVDIPRSIRDGILPNNSNVDDLSEDDLQKLISMKNFDNLRLPVQLILIVEHLQYMRNAMANMPAAKAAETDEYGRTIKHRYRLLKGFAKDLQYMLLRQNCDES